MSYRCCWSWRLDQGADCLILTGGFWRKPAVRTQQHQRFGYHLRLDRAHLARLDDRRVTSRDCGSELAAMKLASLFHSVMSPATS
jgi:hypothetical protein